MEDRATKDSGASIIAPLPVLERQPKGVKVPADRMKLVLGIVLLLLTLTLMVVIGINQSLHSLPVWVILFYIFIFSLLICISWMLVHQAFSTQMPRK